MERLGRRVASLERRGVRLRRTLVGVTLAAGALLLMAQAAPPAETVEAQRLVLRDGGGLERARLGVAVDGTPGIRLSGAGGEILYAHR